MGRRPDRRAWEHGPVILSWADVRADIAAPRDGFCVVAHEIAHKLDALDGAMDGTPAPARLAGQWASDFQRAYDALCARVDAGDDSPIDDYATQSPEEFFAVCTSTTSAIPRDCARRHAEVAAHLQRFYGAPCSHRPAGIWQPRGLRLGAVIQR